MSKTIEQLALEAAAAQKALDKAKSEQARIEQEAKAAAAAERYRIQNEAAVAERRTVLSKVLIAIESALSKTQIVLPNNLEITPDGMRIRGLPYEAAISLKLRYANSSAWRVGTAIGYQIIVGDFGDRRFFPQLKNGAHNYSKITEEVIARIQSAIELAQSRKDQEAAAEASAALVERLRAEFNLDRYSSVVHSLHRAHHVRIDFERSLTEDEARVVLQALDTLGMLATEKKPS